MNQPRPRQNAVPLCCKDHSEETIHRIMDEGTGDDFFYADERLDDDFVIHINRSVLPCRFYTGLS